MASFEGENHLMMEGENEIKPSQEELVTYLRPKLDAAAQPRTQVKQHTGDSLNKRACFKVYERKLNPSYDSSPRKKKCSLSKILSELISFEIVIEILSWLPVKSLLKFRCVCKQWCSLIDQDYKFKAKHMDRASPLQVNYRCKWETSQWCSFHGNFMYVSSCAGLLLEKSLSNSKVFRIRNHGMRRVLYLPDVHEDTCEMNFAFNSFTGECKVASFYWKMVIDLGTEVGLKVITIGKDDEWIPLKFPNQNDKLVLRQPGRYGYRRHPLGPDIVEGAAHIVEIIKGTGGDLYLEVQSFDLWSECFTTTTLPRGVFLDLKNVRPFRWNHCLAVAEIAEEALHVLLLEDFKQQKWSKNKIIVPLKFLKDKPHLKARIMPARADSNELKSHNAVEQIVFYALSNNERFDILCYNIKTEKSQEVTFPTSEGKSCNLRKTTSLITLKGMRPENDYYLADGAKPADDSEVNETKSEDKST